MSEQEQVQLTGYQKLKVENKALEEENEKLKEELKNIKKFLRGE